MFPGSLIGSVWLCALCMATLDWSDAVLPAIWAKPCLMNLLAYGCVTEMNACYKVQGDTSQSSNDGIPHLSFCV